MKNLKIILLVFIVSISTSAELLSQMFHVPAEFISIQSAIDASKHGDTILVDTGRYYENINFRGKNIVVASNYLLSNDTSYIKSTIIDGSKPIHPDSASCVMLISGEDSTAVLDGFTVTNGKGIPVFMNKKNWIEGGGIITYESDAIIRNNIVENNSVVDGGGGVAAWYGNPGFYNNIIMNNKAGYAAGLVLNWSGGTIKNNIIYHNSKTGSSWHTGGLMVWEDGPAEVIIENNTIVGNISTTMAGGLSVTNTKPTIRNNIIWGNRQQSGKQVTGANSTIMSYCNTEDDFTGEGNIASFPLFQPNSFMLDSGSPCIDAGHNSTIFQDVEDYVNEGQARLPAHGTLLNDMGAFGGPLAKFMCGLKIDDIYLSAYHINFGETEIDEDPKSISIEVLNMGTTAIIIDSISLTTNSVDLIKAIKQKELLPFRNDTFSLEWNPVNIGELKDTVKIFHSVKSLENPIKVAVSGKTVEPSSTKNINIQKDIHVSLFPNPSNGILTISIDKKMNKRTYLELRDNKGSIVHYMDHGLALENSSIHLNLRELNIKPGLYYLIINHENKYHAQKFVFN